MPRDWHAGFGRGLRETDRWQHRHRTGVYLTGSGSVVSAQLASRVWTITATAERAGLNPLTYLKAYLDECALAGG
ncbi:MAG: hypothetical protein LC808_16465, partial [Actinobacteria bacterium]|nr:hypothetical protein [Actinomycetota bacterium]